MEATVYLTKPNFIWLFSKLKDDGQMFLLEIYIFIYFRLNDDGQNVFVDKFMSNNIDFCGRRQKMATGKLQGVFNTFK